MNNAVAFAKEIKQKKYAIEKSNSPNLKRQYQKSIKRDIADLKYYCEHNKISINDVWAKVEQGD